MTAIKDPWWKGAAIYQIYPRSFRDSNDDGVGDLKGVLEGLDHVAALGVDGLWLSPFFKSPMRDFGYDVSDYRDVDPVFGTLADFDALTARAHALGLKVIIDQVWSHTSDRHPWFIESRAARTGPRADWYVWADAKEDGSPPNNWLSVFGGPAWEWDSARRQYYLHNFLSAQPDLNFHNPEVREAVLDIADYWLERGVDGFRLDVVNYFAHDASLADNPPAAPASPPRAETFFHQRHVHNCSQPETLDFLRALRKRVDAMGDKMLLGEIFDDEPLARQIEYTGPGLLHTAYSFHLLNAREAAPELFAGALEAWRGAPGWPSWSLGNHDVTRFPTRFFGDAPDARAVRLALAVLLCLRGAAFLYQGDELGLPHAEVAPERLRDPFAIRNRAGSGRDGARTPMPWRAWARNAGFSAAQETWLPVDPRQAALAVDKQERDASSTLAFTAAFLKLRRAHAPLIAGDVEAVSAESGLLSFERVAGASRIFCAFNLTPDSRRLPAPAGALIEAGLGGSVSGGVVLLPAWGGVLIERNEHA